MVDRKAASPSQPAAPAEPKRLIRIGKVGRPHGVRGELRVFTDVADSDSLRRCKALVLELPDGKRSAHVIERIRPADKYWIVLVRGCADRDAAAALTGATCLVDRDDLPATEPGTYYACDLIGLSVVDGAGAALGEVVDVFDNGAHDVLVYRQAGGGEAMVPFTDEFVPTVDLAAGTVVIEPVTVLRGEQEDPA